MEAVLDSDSFVQRLKEVGVSRYHDKHPFNLSMNSGRLTQAQIRGWIANRFYYQRSIPLKDAAILSNMPYREVRRLWLHRIPDHDGSRDGEGGIEAWLKLAEAAGLGRAEVLGGALLLPKVRTAADSYVGFARAKPWPVAVASSLTELFVPDHMSERIRAFEKYYAWVRPGGLDYFRSRVDQARVDSSQALELTLTYCDSRELQEEAVRALSFKCDLLWGLLDAVVEFYGLGEA
ncbi:MAG: pyrroloquinoline-quinone synthase PqqC [bacterium]